MKTQHDDGFDMKSYFDLKLLIFESLVQGSGHSCTPRNLSEHISCHNNSLNYCRYHSFKVVYKKMYFLFKMKNIYAIC